MIVRYKFSLDVYKKSIINSSFSAQAESGQKQQLSSGAVVGIVIAVLLILAIGGSITLGIFFTLRVHPNGKQDLGMGLSEQLEQKQHIEKDQGRIHQKQDQGQEQEKQDQGEEQEKQGLGQKMEGEANPHVYELPDPIQPQPQSSPSPKTADEGDQRMTTSTHKSENNSNRSSSVDLEQK